MSEIDCRNWCDEFELSGPEPQTPTKPLKNLCECGAPECLFSYNLAGAEASFPAESELQILQAQNSMMRAELTSIADHACDDRYDAASDQCMCHPCRAKGLLRLL